MRLRSIARRCFWGSADPRLTRRSAESEPHELRLLHVAPRRRQSDDTRFSQTTLFAVDESEERRRIGRLRRRAQPALLCMSKED